MDFPNVELNQYMLDLTPPRDPVVAEMEAYAKEHKFPIIGPLVVRFLQQLVMMTNSKRIFEMGSGYGYSAVAFAKVLPPDGTVECTEGDAANVERGRQYATRLGVADKITWHHGDGLEFMKQAKGHYDIILNDVDKHQYPDALRIAWPKLRRGGVMVTDNVIWSGKVVSQNPPDKDTKGILEFSKMAYALPDAQCTVLPLRDGLLVAVKK